MNYSKGKWKVIGSFITAPIKDDESKEEYEIEICKLTQYRDDIENKANANLIAAAPDMYEALKEIKKLCAGAAYKQEVERQIIGKCFLALHKAEGRIE